jgi:glyoxylate carboligase
MRDDFEPVHIGNEEHGDEDVTVQVTTDGNGMRHAAFLPAGIGRLGPEGLGMVSDIQHVVEKIREGQEQLEQLVLEARDLGMSWGSIGWSVGTSEAAARQRWGGAS